MFHHPACAVGGYSNGPPPAGTLGTKSTGGFYQADGSPCSQIGEQHILRIHFLDYRERTSRRRRPRHRGIWLARTLLRLRCRSPEGVPGQARTQPQLSSKRPFALPATTLIIMFAQSIVHRQIETFASSTAAMKSKSRNRFRERVSLIFRPVLWHAITRKRPLSVLSSFFRWSLKMCALLDQPLGRP